MKHIIKTQEPQEFTNWKNLENDDWQPTYSLLSNPEKGIVKNSLIQEQGHICCYCEIRISDIDSHIEHFIPQHLPACNDLDYDNMLCSCQDKTPKRFPRHCGKTKDHDKGCDYHPSLLISPLDRTCEDKFEYDLRGNIYPVKDSNDQNDPATEYSIKCLNLDLEKLRRAREEAIDGLIECINIDDIEIISRFLNKDDNGMFPEFYTTIKYLFSR